uniref:Uncharacterized protein n=1 Tax=Zea mays TaxID=4577 RepID=B6U4S3_MAIZE|nr:hypothetical protein [Zea mays]ACG47116.1 hypothetical protein [Zea mays]
MGMLIDKTKQMTLIWWARPLLSLVGLVHHRRLCVLRDWSAAAH